MSFNFVAVTPSSSTRSSGQPGNRNNSLGKNQYKDRPPPDDPQVAAVLKAYHRKGINDNNEISRLLLEEHGMILCESSIRRRKQKLGLRASHATTLQMSEAEKRRLISTQLAKDPKGKFGPRMIKQWIFQDTGIHLTRDYIREEMRKLDPDSYSKRGPRHMKAKRQRRLELEAQGLSVPVSSRRDSPPRPEVPSEPPPVRFIIQVPRDHPTAPSPPEEMAGDADSQSDNDPTRDQSQEESCFFPDHSILGNNEEQLQIGPSLSTNPPETLDAITLLQNAMPGMGALTQFLHNLDTNLALDRQTYELLIRGMESAALLERQLARVLSRGRDHRR